MSHSNHQRGCEYPSPHITHVAGSLKSTERHLSTGHLIGHHPSTTLIPQQLTPSLYAGRAAMAPSPELRIDTSVVYDLSPPSTKSLSRQGLKPESAQPSGDRRLRNLSPTSTSSTLSLVSPTPSSTNASSLSVHAPTASASYTTTVISDTVASPPAIYVSERSSPEYVLAMHDFIPQQKNATCLAFRAGQIIHVLNRDSSGWWDGELDGKRGWFPSNYVNGDLGLLADDVMASVPVSLKCPSKPIILCLLIRGSSAWGQVILTLNLQCQWLHLRAQHRRGRARFLETTTVHH